MLKRTYQTIPSDVPEDRILDERNILDIKDKIWALGVPCYQIFEDEEHL